MGGAQRSERQRRRQATRDGSATKPGSKPGPKPVSKPGSKPGSRPAAASVSSGGDDRRRVGVMVAVVALIVAAVIGGVLWQRSRSGPGPAEAKQVAAAYPVVLEDGVVIAGKDDASVTVDIYEDFLCPACGNFENRDGAAIDSALVDGSVRVRYHIVNILDDLSNPPGYSTDAGNAAMCAADAGQFPSYHASLFAKQPREGGRGYTDDQLVQLGRDVGITDSTFESCVRSGTHDNDVRAQEQAAAADESLLRTYPDGRRAFATPTVVVDGERVDIGDSSAWLTSAID